MADQLPDPFARLRRPRTDLEARTALEAFCQGKPRRCIPAEADDHDMVISDVIDEWTALRKRVGELEQQLAGSGDLIRMELEGVIEEVEAFSRGTVFKVLLANREGGPAWGAWSLRLPSVEAARVLGAHLYRRTSAVVFLRIPEGP